MTDKTLIEKLERIKYAPGEIPNWNTENQWIDEVIAIVRQHESQAKKVSLEKCARALFAANGLGTAFWEQADKKPFYEKASAVLQAANVPWEE